MLAPEHTVGELTVADVAAKIIETERDGDRHFYAAASPVADEWCYLADGEDLDELEVAVEALLDDEPARSVFVRCAALMGVPWNEGQMVPLLVAQLTNGEALMAAAPDAANADPEQLRGIRRATQAEASADN